MLTEILQKLFFTNRNSYAQARNASGTISYFPLEGTPSEKQLDQHIRGEIVLGSYTLMADSTVDHIVWDVDSTDLVKARNIAAAISEQLGKIPHGIEFSGNKGYHIWIFLEKPVSAAKAKAFGVHLRESVGAPTSGDPHVEVFPKQESLTPSSPLGNLVKLPLGEHPKTHNRSIFVDRENGWEAGPEVDPISVLSAKVDFEILEESLVGTSPLERMTLLLGGYWTSGERHNLALALSGFLASLGWAKDDVTELIQSLIDDYGGDPENLLDCVTTTFKRLTANQTVQGFGALNERLPVTVMRALSELAGQNIADPTIQLIDRIRLEKGPSPFQRVRSAGSTMFSNLQDTGRFVKTENISYWLDLGNHQLVDLESTQWLSLMHRKFGINSKEGFGTQVLEFLRLQAFERSDLVKVHKRFHWDGSTLHINFGGAEVYKLTGNRSQRSISYNGAEEFLFMSCETGLGEELSTRNLFEADPLNPWDFLTNDLSFDPTENQRASNEQQRQLLQAWILQLFFGSILNTRPIALLMGPRGSGKTTTARRILRFFEGFQEDVLGIVEDKPDSLRASLEDHLVLALDNMEKTKVRWLDNLLNRLATGAQIEIRQLYKSNEKYTIRPDCFVLATGIELPTSEESLYSRILPFDLSPLLAPRSEYLIQSRLKDNMVGIWSGMFDYLDGVIHELKSVGAIAVPNSSRLADFVMFCHRIKRCSALDGDQLSAGLASLVERQNQTMAASSPAIQVLDLWLEACAKQRILTDPDRDPQSWRNAGGLWKILNDVARKDKIEGFRWTTPASFARHWGLLVRGGLNNVHFETRSQYNPSNGREEEQYRFPLMELRD